MNFKLQAAAKKLACSVDQVKRHVELGELVAYDIGTGNQRQRLVITEDSIAAFIERRTVTKAAPAKRPKTQAKTPSKWKWVK